MAMTEEDWVWAEHQEHERLRRAPLLVTPPRRRPSLDIFAVIRVVEADFARWESERREASITKESMR